MFKKTGKANLRKRRDTEEEESSSNDVTKQNLNAFNSLTNIDPGEGSVKSKKGKSKKGKKAATVSVLSFGDEETEEEESFQIKKSSRSKRIAKQIKKRALEEKEAETNGPAIQIQESSSIVQQAVEDVHIFRSKKTEEEPPPAPAQPSLQSHFSTMSPGAIPTPSMIHAARKQREMLRKFGSEYIPIDDTQKYKENSKSRLVREDDFDGSSDEEIIEMKGIEKAKSKPLVPNQSEDEENGDEEEEAQDEEVDRWEEEMIKKGINTQQQPTMPATNHPHHQHSAVHPNYQAQNADYSNQAYVNLYYGQQNNVNTMPQTAAKSDASFSLIKKRLEEHLSTSRKAHQDHQAEMDRLIYDTSECKHISNHLSDTVTLSRDYQFYQEMKQYLRDLVSCLQETVPDITNLDETVHELWQSQAKDLIERRCQDVRDECTQCSTSSKPGDKAQSDADFVNRVRERQARRTRRKAHRQITRTLNTHHDGQSTDDEATSIGQAKFTTEMEKVHSSLNDVFEDVIEDFCDVECILKRFAGWRAQHEDSYLDAYIALCIPKLVTPYVKFKLILWNPLLSDDESFESFDWFKSLSMYGVQKAVEDDKYADDAKLVSTIVEKVVTSKITRLVQNVWDPLSTQQTTRLIAVIQQLTQDYAFMSAKNRHCQSLVQGICKRIQKCLENDVFIPLLPPSNKQDIGNEFLERQTWSCIKLFKNILLFDGTLSYSILCELAFDALLNRYIMLALQTSPLNFGCLQKCQEITKCIPRHWYEKHDSIKQHLAGLSRLLIHLGKATSQTGEVMFRKEVKVMLFKIGFRDSLAELK
uniref:PAX3- and PAX7-binding protein 1-like n=1 Tax=Phallusia mammillata TaxID=59560 RepID=A0A6F9DML4_9ASCI|nr:PAX3- and PAX7-binding protein 1-like [Phallusia mammillata]